MCQLRPHRPRPFAELVLSEAEGLRVTLVKLVLMAYLDPTRSNGVTPLFSLLE